MTTPAPVEISERFQPGAWTRELLEAHMASYRRKLMDMGALETDIEEVVKENDDGSVDVIARWTAAPSPL